MQFYSEQSVTFGNSYYGKFFTNRDIQGRICTGYLVDYYSRVELLQG